MQIDAHAPQPTPEERLRQAEAALAETKQKLYEALARLKFLELSDVHASFLENTTEGVIFTDASDAVTYANPCLLRMVGVESPGALLFRALPDDLWEAPEEKGQLFQDLKAGHFVRDREWVLRTLKGERLVVLCNATPVQEKEGAYTGGAIILRDITDRRQLELELRQQNEAYAQLVEELQRSLATLRETQHRLMAEANLAAASDLGAGLLHELSDAASIIEVRAYLLQHTVSLDEPALNALRQMREAGDRIAAAAVSLRNLPRHRESPVHFDLRGALQEVLAELNSNHMLDDYQVEVEQPATPIVTHGHRLQIQQALRNIIINAGEALSKLPGQALKRLSLRLTSSGDTASIDVHDNGPGFEEKVLQRLYRPGNSTKAVKGHARGLGLGLFIAHQVLKAHGGHLNVDSEPGAGATVRLTLPLAPSCPQT
jgi:PAS domain S-box-containing protein